MEFLLGSSRNVQWNWLVPSIVSSNSWDGHRVIPCFTSIHVRTIPYPCSPSSAKSWNLLFINKPNGTSSAMMLSVVDQITAQLTLSFLSQTWINILDKGNKEAIKRWLTLRALNVNHLVWHYGLCAKLTAKGLTGKLHTWLQKYLHGWSAIFHLYKQWCGQLWEHASLREWFHHLRTHDTIKHARGGKQPKQRRDNIRKWDDGALLWEFQNQTPGTDGNSRTPMDKPPFLHL